MGTGSEQFQRMPRCVAAVLWAVVFVSAGCGLKFSWLATPAYRMPSGYSETYRNRLDEFERRSRRRELVDPSLSRIPASPPLRLRPVPDQNESSESAAKPPRTADPPFPRSKDPNQPDERNGTDSR